MNPQEKAAWYMLAVVAYFVMLSLTGHPGASIAAFSLLALIAFSPMFATGKKSKIVADEHDQLISLKATRVGFRVFWLYFVGYCVVASGFLEYVQSIPSYLFILLVVTGLCVMLAARSIATLALYRADATENRTMVDRYMKMSGMRKSGLWMIVIGMLVMLPFMIVMIEVGQGNVPQLSGYLICGSFAVVYFLTRHYLGIGVSSDKEIAELARVRKRGDRALVTGFFAVVCGLGFSLGLARVWPVEIAIVPRIPLVIFYGLMIAWLGLGVSAFFSGTNFIVEYKSGAKEQQNA